MVGPALAAAEAGWTAFRLSPGGTCAEPAARLTGVRNPGPPLATQALTALRGESPILRTARHRDAIW